MPQVTTCIYSILTFCALTLHQYVAQSCIRHFLVHWCQVRHLLGFALCICEHINSSLGQSSVAQCRSASSCKSTVAKVRVNLSGVSDASAACSICPTLPYRISTCKIPYLSAVFTPLFARARRNCIVAVHCMLNEKYTPLDCFETSHRWVFSSDHLQAISVWSCLVLAGSHTI